MGGGGCCPSSMSLMACLKPSLIGRCLFTLCVGWGDSSEVVTGCEGCGSASSTFSSAVADSSSSSSEGVGVVSSAPLPSTVVCGGMKPFG